MGRILIAKVGCYIPGTGVSTLYFSDQPYCSKPADTPANTPYTPRISEPGYVQRSMFSDGRTSGATEVAFGMVDLVNVDGALDALKGYGFDGQVLELIEGIVLERSAGVPTFTTIFKGTMRKPYIGWKKITLRPKDRHFELLQKSVQRNKYGGTNALPAGVDGVADLKGKPIPVLYGNGFKLPCPCVNTSKLTYQAHDGALLSIPAVYDRGLALTPGADYATVALLHAAAPAASTYITCLALGYFRLGSKSDGLVTCDAVQGANAAARTVAQVLKSMMLSAGISSGDITAGDVTALDTANAAEIGYWASHDAEIPFTTAMDEVANSVSAWYGPSRLGVFKMGQVIAPTGTAAATLTELEIIDIDSVDSQDEGAGLPATRVNLHYKKYYATQETAQTAVTAATQADLRLQYRRVTDNDASVLTKNALAPEINFYSLMSDATAAQTECTRLLAIHEVERDTLKVRAYMSPANTAAIDIGATITLQVDRFDYTAGKKMLVLGVLPDPATQTADITLWG